MRKRSFRYPVVVISGNECTEIAIAESLGRYNIPIFLLNKEEKKPLSSYHKYIKKNFTAPDPKTDLKGFIVFLEELGNKLLKKFRKRILLFPTDDSALLILGRNYLLFKKYFVILGDRKEKDILWLSDKSFLFEKLFEAGFREFLPKTFSFSKLEDIEKIKDNIEFPCILKPSQKDISFSFYKMYGSKILIVNNKEEFLKRVNLHLERGDKLLVQEMVNRRQGREICFWGYRNKVGKTFGLTIREIRKFPLIGGSACFEEIEEIPKIKDYASKILELLDFWGMCEMPFMLDERDNNYKLLEINYRCWFQILLAIENGFNFPYIAYREVYHNLYLSPKKDIEGRRRWMNIEHDFLRWIIKEERPIVEKIIIWIPQVFKETIHGIFSTTDRKIFLIWILRWLFKLKNKIFRIKKLLIKKDGVNQD